MFRQLHMVAAGDLRLYALLLFFVIFVAVLARAFVLRRSEDYRSVERLPLEDEESGR
jgi:hypothetical protein